MLDYLELIFWPLIASFVLTGIHVYFGLHVVKRGVIFVDLALAQVAALGTAIGILIGLGHDSFPTYLIGLGFTFLGALLFSVTKSKNERIPQESIIGITYVVAAAMMILLFSKSPEGAEHLNHLLVGSILFISPEVVGITFLLYCAIGIFHWKFRHQFLMASNPQYTDQFKSQRLWDFLFYVTFGLVVTSSVKIAGVLLVFSFLIIPAVSAVLFIKGDAKRLLFGWAFGIIGSMSGMIASMIFDVPTGATIVVTFGFMLSILGILKIRSQTEK